STRNTHIEHMWVEVGSQVACPWHAFLTCLERLHRLDPFDTTHLWLIHRLFIKSINDDLGQFVEQWNHHPISGNAHNQTPDVSFRF
ncbi:hypothetical protein BDQ17DRAFT_1168909, partial [Cyathus striatus]